MPSTSSPILKEMVIILINTLVVSLTLAFLIIIIMTVSLTEEKKMR